ncbi:MAG: YezD family protein [Actinomycetota bacterium]
MAELAQPNDFTSEEQDVLQQVAVILRRLRYGTVLLVVQDGKVVQSEMAEKFRLT